MEMIAPPRGRPRKDRLLGPGLAMLWGCGRRAARHVASGACANVPFHETMQQMQQIGTLTNILISTERAWLKMIGSLPYHHFWDLGQRITAQTFLKKTHLESRLLEPTVPWKTLQIVPRYNRLTMSLELFQLHKVASDAVVLLELLKDPILQARGQDFCFGFGPQTSGREVWPL